MSAYFNNIHPAYIYPGARILLADDIQMDQQVFRDLIRPWQMKIDVVTNGRDAVEAVHKHGYQMIFLDQMMPEMEGNQAAELIHQYSDAPIIMITSNFEEQDLTEYPCCGGVVFLAKPIRLQVLQQILDTYMPREYRCDAHCYGESRSISREGIDVSKGILETFIREVRLLARDLPTYAKQDIELFRIKVHGIKGSSGQLGKSVLSEAAEAMEIAAKTRDWAYIESHMQSFRWKILTTAEELEAEWEYSTEQAEREYSVEYEGREYRAEHAERKRSAEHAVREESRICEENQGVKKLFELLHAGFDGYCIKQIESSIYALEHAELTPSERELLAKAKEAYEELEYEAGSALFS